MNNGDGLNIAKVDETGSSVTQGVVIIPKPNNDLIYYIFVISDSTLCYSTVDISLFAGLGGVVEKNSIILHHKLTEKLQAVKHGNGQDWWLITRKYGTPPDSSDLFYKLLITSDTIKIFEQNSGCFVSGLDAGEMTFTQDGNILAFVDKSGLSTFTFDRCTGNLEQTYHINKADISIDLLYGCAFSSDGNKLYISTEATQEYSKLFQYCLNCNDPFPETKKLIYELEVPFDFDVPEYTLGQIELGPDEKIYLVTGHNVNPNSVYSMWNQNLSVINSPDIEGQLCDLDTNSIWLGGKRATAGLPNMSNYNLGPLVGSACDTLLVIGDNPRPSGIHVYPNPATDQIYFSGNAAYTGSHVQLRIYNLLGEEAFTMSNIPFNTAIQLPELTNGLYEVVLENGKRRLFADELIIQR